MTHQAKFFDHYQTRARIRQWHHSEQQLSVQTHIIFQYHLLAFWCVTDKTVESMEKRLLPIIAKTVAVERTESDCEPSGRRHTVV